MVVMRVFSGFSRTGLRIFASWLCSFGVFKTNGYVLDDATGAPATCIDAR